MRNLVDFDASSDKSKNLHFDFLHLFSAILHLLSLMTLKSDPNFEEKLTFCLKKDMKNLVNFNMGIGKSENLHFDGLLL